MRKSFECLLSSWTLPTPVTAPGVVQVRAQKPGNPCPRCPCPALVTCLLLRPDFTQVCFPPEPTDELCTSSPLGLPARRTFHLFSAEVCWAHRGELASSRGVTEPWTRSWRTWLPASPVRPSSGSWDHDARLPTSQGCCEVQMRPHTFTLLKL